MRNPVVGSPKAFVGESVARTRFQITLEGERLRFSREGEVSLETPRSMRSGADVLAGVVDDQSLAKIFSVADISTAGG